MVFKKIQQEFGSFGNYLKSFTKDKVIYENDKSYKNKKYRAYNGCF